MNNSLDSAIRSLLRDVLIEVVREALPRVSEPQRRGDATSAVPPFQLLRPKEAAQSLGISERQLWKMTKAGGLACVKINRLVRYDPAVLREWISRPNSAANFENEQRCGSINECSGARTAKGDRKDWISCTRQKREKVDSSSRRSSG